MSLTLAEALGLVDLEAGKVYRCRVKGHWVERRVLGPVEDRPPAPLDEADVRLDPWADFPPRADGLCDRPAHAPAPSGRPRDPGRGRRVMIYDTPGHDDPIDQADLIEDCPVLSLSEYDPDGLNPPRTNVALGRVLVLTQACDIANRKTSSATIAVVYDARSLVEQELIKAADVRGPIRAGRVFGWYFLPASGGHGLTEMIVDLRQLHTARLDLLAALCQRGRRRARVRSPYREHLANHFADT
jgi:hypothetical protein